jgi:hypothetical protein
MEWVHERIMSSRICHEVKIFFEAFELFIEFIVGIYNRFGDYL